MTAIFGRCQFCQSIELIYGDQRKPFAALFIPHEYRTVFRKPEIGIDIACELVGRDIFVFSQALNSSRVANETLCEAVDVEPFRRGE